MVSGVALCVVVSMMSVDVCIALMRLCCRAAVWCEVMLLGDARCRFV